LIADLQLPIADWPEAKHQSEIDNRQSAIGPPTRYRVVVLTSWAPSPFCYPMRM